MNFPMQVHQLEPGSLEWLRHRFDCNNASDAAAMLSCDPNRSRTDLLDALVNGFTKEASDFQEKIYAGGHRLEALARPVAEAIIGEDLYQLVATRRWDGLTRPLGASSDGLTIARDRNWEHKQLNDELRDALPHAGAEGATLNDAANLPKRYRVQPEQQLMVFGCEVVLFTASDWDAAGNLIDARHCWYRSDPALRAEIVAGWIQAEADLPRHIPVAHQERPQGEKREALPMLVVQVEGRIVSSNLPVWREAALAHIRGINKDLQSDEDFANAKEAVKWCDDSAKKLKLLKEQTLAQMVDVNELIGTLDTIVSGLDRTRIDLGNLVTSRETAIRNEVARRGEQELFAHLANLNVRVGRAYLPAATHPLIAADFQKAIKSKRTIKSLNDSVDAELARCKIAASGLADRIQANLKYLAESCADHLALFADERTLVLKECDDFRAIASGRVNEAKAAEEKRLEAERERIRAEEQAKAEKAAREKVEAEQREQRQRESEQSQQRAVEIAREIVATANQPPAEAPAPAAEPVEPLSRAVGAPMWGGGNVTLEHAANAPAANVVQIQRPAAAPTAPPTLRLGVINERLAPLQLTADGLAALGFPPAGKERSAVLYHEHQFTSICEAIERHAGNVRERHARQAA
jgi:predicted phage-related endonuclease